MSSNKSHKRPYKDKEAKSSNDGVGRQRHGGKMQGPYKGNKKGGK